MLGATEQDERVPRGYDAPSMFDYVETRTFSLAPEDIGAAATAVLAQTAKTSALAVAPGIWQGEGVAESLGVTPRYELRASPAPAGTKVELRVAHAIGIFGWAIVVALFFVFFPGALLLLLGLRERFRKRARLTAASVFASLGTTSGLVAAGYAAAPPP